MFQVCVFDVLYMQHGWVSLLTLVTCQPSPAVLAHMTS